MKVLHFLFQDFWRKLVALVFAVAIYLQVDDSVKQHKASGSAPGATEIQHREDTVAVRILDLGGADRLVVFSDGVKPEVKVSLYGVKDELEKLKKEDLLFYVVAAKELKPGEHVLPVFCYSRRPEVKTGSIEPAKIRVSVVENSVDNQKN